MAVLILKSGTIKFICSLDAIPLSLAADDQRPFKHGGKTTHDPQLKILEETKGIQHRKDAFLNWFPKNSFFSVQNWQFYFFQAFKLHACMYLKVSNPFQWN